MLKGYLIVGLFISVECSSMKCYDKKCRTSYFNYVDCNQEKYRCYKYNEYTGKKGKCVLRPDGTSGDGYIYCNDPLVCDSYVETGRAICSEPERFEHSVPFFLLVSFLGAGIPIGLLCTWARWKQIKDFFCPRSSNPVRNVARNQTSGHVDGRTRSQFSLGWGPTSAHPQDNSHSLLAARENSSAQRPSATRTNPSPRYPAPQDSSAARNSSAQQPAATNPSPTFTAAQDSPTVRNTAAQQPAATNPSPTYSYTSAQDFPAARNSSAQILSTIEPSSRHPSAPEAPPEYPAVQFQRVEEYLPDNGYPPPRRLGDNSAPPPSYDDAVKLS